MNYASQIPFIILQYANGIHTIVPCVDISVSKIATEISDVINKITEDIKEDVAPLISSRLHYWCETFQMLTLPVFNIGESMFIYVPYPYVAEEPKEDINTILKLYPEYKEEK